MSKKYIVVGTGFRGYCDTVELLKAGHQVHMIESSAFFGGVMNSIPVNGFFIDKGVHVFDSIPVSLADHINEVMNGKVRSIQFNSASVFNGILTEGFSLPDLSSLSEELKGKIALELLSIAVCESFVNSKNLKELLHSRFGMTVGKIFSDIFARVYGVLADQVESSAIALTSLGRLKFLEDEKMMVLKANPRLDAILAARRKTLGKVDDLVSIYPDNGQAMKGWCDLSLQWLIEHGVQITLGEKILSIKDGSNKVIVSTDKQNIEADGVIWANDNVQALADALSLDFNVKSLLSNTPMIFLTLFTKAEHIKNFTYMQNFDQNAKTYRTAAAGIYSGQISKDGISFLTCECPTLMGSNDWENPHALIDQVWLDCKKFGVVDEFATLHNGIFHRLPVSFKVPLVGHHRKIEEFTFRLKDTSKKVILRSLIPFFRREIYLDSLKIHEVL